MITVQLISKPIAPPLNDATKSIAYALLSNRTTCAYRFFGTPDSHVLEAPYVSCEVVTMSGTRFQPGFAEQGRTLLRLLTSRDKISIYHCLFTPNPRSSTTLKLVLRTKRRPIVHTLCSSPEDWPGTLRLLFADRVVTVSAWAKHHLEAQGVRDVVHIPPGIDPPVVSESAMARLARDYDIGAGRPCILFSGDYEFSQAHDVIIKALPQITARYGDAVLVFACRAKTPHAHAIEAAVRQRLHSAGLLPYVRFAGEIEDFPSLLALATVVIFPVQSLKLKMDIPVTLLQALALGVPIVTSTYGPLPELLVEPVGLGVPPGDADALAAAVTALLDDPARRADMGSAGRRMVLQRYSSAGMARAYEDLYASL